MTWMGRRLGQFGKLWPAEQKLVDEMGTGMTVKISPGLPPKDGPKEHRIRASFLRYLALGGCDACRPPEKGVRLVGAFIEGDGPEGAETRGLDLEGCTVTGDLVLVRCRFPDLVLLRAARIATLSLGEAALTCGLKGDRLVATGGVFLRGLIATGEVRLVGARIGGDLDCNQAVFRADPHMQSKSRSALNADGVEALGGVNLLNVFATGEVRLIGARLGGDLNCTNGTFRAGEGAEDDREYSLSADRLTIEGTLFLRGRLLIKGVLSLVNARVGALNDQMEAWPQAGLLRLDQFRYGAITGGPVDADSRLHWLKLQDQKRWSADFWPQPYEQLAKVLREKGYEDEAKTVLVEKEHRLRLAVYVRMTRLPDGGRGARLRARARSLPWSIAHGLWTRLLKMVAYGYRPERALWPALVLVLIGWAVTHLSANAGLMLPVTPAAGAPAAVLLPPAYAFENFVPIVSLGQTAAFRPDMTEQWGLGLQVFLWLHAFAGWLIGGIAAAGVLGLFQRR
jgi:hypothetical protein